MSVLITMRVQVHDFEGARKAAEMVARSARQAGGHWAKAYRSEKDPDDVSSLMEWESGLASLRRAASRPVRAICLRPQ